MTTIIVMIVSFIVGMLVGGLVTVVLLIDYCQNHKK